jgi:hypothetical protein
MAVTSETKSRNFVPDFKKGLREIVLDELEGGNGGVPLDYEVQRSVS